MHRAFALSILALLATTALLGGSLSAAEPEIAATLHEYDFYVKEFFTIEPVQGNKIGTIAFGLSPDGPFSVPGPTIRMREGDTLRVRLHDTGGFSGHTIHFHGIKLPWQMDGMPWMTQAISPPGSHAVYTYEFTATQSGTFWYHCHVDAPVHLDIGMFGALIIEPKHPKLELPYSRDYTLMLHEMDSTVFAQGDASQGHPDDLLSNPANPFDAVDGNVNGLRQTYDIATGYLLPDPIRGIAGAQGPREYYPEWSIRYRPQYDTFMINGKSFPETEPIMIKEGETIRLRIINAGQLVHTMHLHGHDILVTHKDGRRLAVPWLADTVLIGPGERYDVYVKGDNIGHWDLHDHGGAWGVGGFTANDHAFPGGMSTMLMYEGFDPNPLPAPVPTGDGDAGALAGVRIALPGHVH